MREWMVEERREMRVAERERERERDIS